MCLHCSHPVSHHKLLPMLLNPAKKRENISMLTTLNTVLKPDLSLPSTVKGVDMDKVADQITKHHKRNTVEEQKKRNVTAKETCQLGNTEPTFGTANSFDSSYDQSTLERAEKTSLTTAISALEVNNAYTLYVCFLCFFFLFHTFALVLRPFMLWAYLTSPFCMCPLLPCPGAGRCHQYRVLGPRRSQLKTAPHDIGYPHHTHQSDTCLPLHRTDSKWYDCLLCTLQIHDLIKHAPS